MDVTKSHVGELLAVPALAAAGVLWGLTFLFGKWALEEMGLAHLMLLRFALASAALLPYTLLKGVWPRQRDLPLFLLGRLAERAGHVPSAVLGTLAH